MFKDVEENEIKELLKKMNTLYITYRQSFLQQYEYGYSTQKYCLTDSILKQHLLQKRTIGIHIGTQGLTKFMSWDVDFANDLLKAQEVTVKIIKALNEYYGIPLENIHTDFSGSKGYHVTLFFDGIVQDVNLIPFYKDVVKYIKESENQVEFRCSTAYGMKLPLGINQKSKLFMCFVKYDPVSETLTHLSSEDSYQYLYKINPLLLEEFKEMVLDEVCTSVEKIDTKLSTKQANNYEQIAKEININGKSIQDLEDEITKVLKQGHLTYRSSRNRVTFLLSIFLKEQGFAEIEVLDMINEILLNTYDFHRELISEDTTKKYLLSESKRITENTFKKDYNFTTRRKDIYIYKWEIEQILSLKQLHLKQLLFSLLVHSKRYAKPKKDNIFYMSYSTMTRMGNPENRKELRNHLIALEAKGFIKIKSMNQVDTVLSKIEGSVVKKPNEYLLNLIPNDKQSLDTAKIVLKANKEMTLAQVTSLLIDSTTVKKILPRKQWENTFKSEYIS